MNTVLKMWIDDGSEIWTEGWKVLWRHFVFRLTCLLLASPIVLFHWFIKKRLEEDQNPSGAVVYSLSAFVAIIVFLPFIYFIASRLRGEFIYPGYKAQETESEINIEPVN